MNRASRNLLATTTIALLVTTTCAQAQQKKQSQKQKQSSSHNWKQVINQMHDQGLTLQDAIDQAVNQVGGQAISARVMTEFQRPADAERYESDNVSQYRLEVLCRTDNGKFKIVTIDGRNGDILGTSTAAASRYKHQQNTETDRHRRGSDRDWLIGRDRFVVFRLMPYSELGDANVRNNAGHSLGEVTDLAINPQTGEVNYAALSFGGWLGMGDKLFAVPLQTVNVIDDDLARLDLTRQELKNAQGFDQDNWPKHADPRWAARLKSTTQDEYELVAHEEQQKNKQKTEKERRMKDTPVRRASDIVGLTVKNKHGDTLGTIDNLYVDPDRAQVCYAVLSHGGWLGMGDTLLAIPWQRFEQTQSDTLILDMSKDQLKRAPRASASDMNAWTDPDWIVTVYEFYEVEPYWDDTARGPHAEIAM